MTLFLSLSLTLCLSNKNKQISEDFKLLTCRARSQQSISDKALQWWSLWSPLVWCSGSVRSSFLSKHSSSYLGWGCSFTHAHLAMPKIIHRQHFSFHWEIWLPNRLKYLWQLKSLYSFLEGRNLRNKMNIQRLLVLALKHRGGQANPIPSIPWGASEKWRSAQTISVESPRKPK